MRDGWTETTLDSLLESQIGGVWGDDPGVGEVDVPVYRQTEFAHDGQLSIPAGASRSVSKAQLASRLLREGDILIQKSAGTPTLPGRVVRVPNLPEASIFSNFLTRLRADELKVNGVYLFLTLQRLHATGVAHEHQRGTNIRNLDLSAYLRTRVEIPPLEEQRRIVDLIESIDAYIAALEAEEAALAATRSNLLGELLTRRGEDWIETTLGDIASVISGGTPSTQVPEYWGGDIVWTTPTEVVASNGGMITTSSRRLSATGLANSSAKMLPPGAVLLTSRATIGAVALAGVPLCTNQGFASLVCGPSVLPKFLLYWCTVNTAEFTSRASGNTFPEISRSKVAGVPLVLPPLREQRRIVDLVESVDTAIADAAGARQSAVALRRATLGALLSGDHEIPSSYDDLLETV